MARRRKQESAWPAVLAFGAIAGVIGAVVYANRAQATPQAPPVTPQPTPLPQIPALPTLPPISIPGASPTVADSVFTALVTDPAQVTASQNIVARSLTATPSQFGATLANYGPADVDGNPSNPRWMHVLSLIQSTLNAALPAIALTGVLPPGYPTQLRTDGVLDQATSLAIAHG